MRDILLRRGCLDVAPSSLAEIRHFGSASADAQILPKHSPAREIGCFQVRDHEVKD